jgi:hypothetical protein
MLILTKPRKKDKKEREMEDKRNRVERIREKIW